MLRGLCQFVVGVGANVLVRPPAFAQSPADVTLTRIDYAPAPRRRTSASASPTRSRPNLKLTFTFSCYLIKHGDAYIVWDTGFGYR